MLSGQSRLQGVKAAEAAAGSRALGGERYEAYLSAPAIHCAGCMRTIERGLSDLPGVESARVNLSTKGVLVRWDGSACEPDSILAKLKDLGFDAHIADLGQGGEEADHTLRLLVRCLAVSGFAAANVMMFSLSVWSGAEAGTRELFHWVSALIAVPCVFYAGRPFFQSAWAALAARRVNMDVPISLAVLLALGLSLYEMTAGDGDTYFDASVALLFFLLIGRTLDHMMREKARSVVKGLMNLTPRGASLIADDGSRSFIPAQAIEPGMRLAVAPGERAAVDSVVVEGMSDLDCSLVTGESDPKTVGPGSLVQAGSLNLSAPLTVTASSTAADSFLGQMVRLTAAAEAGRDRYRRLADRAAEIYVPVVHAVAALTLVGWLMATGDLRLAVVTAIAVLIITCPCALGLAIPMVQVVAAGRLFEHGIMVKGGSALERLGEADAVVFDKTGTLTLGEPALMNADEIDEADLALAAALARHSRHPLSRALLRAAGGADPPLQAVGEARERPGDGLEAEIDGATMRLGRRAWAAPESDYAETARDDGSSEVVLSEDWSVKACFRFTDAVRQDAPQAIAALAAQGLPVEVISGDRATAVRRLAEALRIDRARHGCLPRDKVALIESRQSQGQKVLMVGDGLNDGPALSAAHVSMAPSSASDLGRQAADLVFLRESLEAVPLAIAVARKARVLILQNLGLAALYNLVAVPLAVAGLATPLVAAIAMSASSLIVTLNALRLRRA